MSERTANVIVDAPELDKIDNAGFRDLDPDGVLEQPFWDRYNRNLEAPIAWSFAVFLFVACIGVFVMLAVFGPSRDRTPVSITNLDGDDDRGVGSAGGGGEPTPLALGDPPKAAELEKFKTPDINEAIDEVREKINLDVGGAVEVPDSAVVAIAALNKELRDKMNGTKRGEKGNGSGGENQGGGGPGGFGNDPTRARGLRWVLKFDTRTGRDYLDQLHAMKAVVMVPTADSKKMYIFKDLKAPKFGPVAADAELEEMAGQVQFTDVRKQSVDAVCEALGITGYTPNSFWAIFPKGVERELADLELHYKNKNPKDVRQTIFKVIVRGGTAQFIVIDQQMK